MRITRPHSGNIPQRCSSSIWVWKAQDIICLSDTVTNDVLTGTCGSILRILNWMPFETLTVMPLVGRIQFEDSALMFLFIVHTHFHIHTDGWPVPAPTRCYFFRLQLFFCQYKSARIRYILLFPCSFLPFLPSSLSPLLLLVSSKWYTFVNYYLYRILIQYFLISFWVNPLFYIMDSFN